MSIKLGDLVTCPICYKQFLANANTVFRTNHFPHKKICCSRRCGELKLTTRKQVSCTQCNKQFIKKYAEITKNNFCTRSCSVTYQNTHKTKGNRRSKLEKWLEQQLLILYPKLEFKFNSKEDINSELDIFIPSLKLAFELNGIFHYEPIFGQTKLDQIQNNDHRKFQACAENSIALCIIDVSKIKYHKESTSRPILDIIINIINQALADGYDPPSVVSETTVLTN